MTPLRTRIAEWRELCEKRDECSEAEALGKLPQALDALEVLSDYAKRISTDKRFSYPKRQEAREVIAQAEEMLNG